MNVRLDDAASRTDVTDFSEHMNSVKGTEKGIYIKNN